MSSIIVGYRHWGDSFTCVYCHEHFAMIEDDNEPRGYLVRCWCGGTCRVARDDPDLILILAAFPGGGDR